MFLQVKSSDGVGLVFKPLSLPLGTQAMVIPILASDLACPLGGRSRFVPFGYKGMTIEPAIGDLSNPAVLEWQISEHYSSLQQIKFAFTPSVGELL